MILSGASKVAKQPSYITLLRTKFFFQKKSYTGIDTFLPQKVNKIIVKNVLFELAKVLKLIYAPY